MVVEVGGERSRRNTLNFTNWMRRGCRSLNVVRRYGVPAAQPYTRMCKCEDLG